MCARTQDFLDVSKGIGLTVRWFHFSLIISLRDASLQDSTKERLQRHMSYRGPQVLVPRVRELEQPVESFLFCCWLVGLSRFSLLGDVDTNSEEVCTTASMRMSLYLIYAMCHIRLHLEKDSHDRWKTEGDACLYYSRRRRRRLSLAAASNGLHKRVIWLSSVKFQVLNCDMESWSHCQCLQTPLLVFDWSKSCRLTCSCQFFC